MLVRVSRPSRQMVTEESDMAMSLAGSRQATPVEALESGEPSASISLHSGNCSSMGKGRHFVLVHGGAHGAWCWYRTINLLRQAGHKASAVDLAGGGTDSTDVNTIASLAQIAAPLVSLFKALPESEQVILVLHSLGGLSGAVVMELFPCKIAAAVFVAACMFPDPSHEEAHPLVLKIFREAFAKLSGGFVSAFANGPERPPTSVQFIPDAEPIRRNFYQLSPPEDVVLASLCLKPMPTLNPSEYLVPLTPKGYSSVPRVYVECNQDRLLPSELVDAMCQALPPHRRISLQADHSPFFSAPLALHNLLLKLAAAYCTP